MSKKIKIQSIETLSKALEGEDLSPLWISTERKVPWNTLPPEELEDFVTTTLELVRSAIDSNLLIDLPYANLNQLNGHLTNFQNQLTAFKAFPSEQVTNQHHATINQIGAIDSGLRASGLYSLLKLSPNFGSTVETLNSQTQIAVQQADELGKLTNQVRELLDPAVAGNISKAFADRKSQVERQKYFWFFLVLVSGVVSGWLTLDITSHLSTVFTTSSPIDPASEFEKIGTMSFVWFLRLLLLVPAYFFIWFSVSQFLTERRFEEDYAHKASIAATLPSYSELIVKPDVKDEITLSATRIVFAPPLGAKDKKTSKKGITAGELKDFADAFNKLKLPEF